MCGVLCNGPTWLPTASKACCCARIHRVTARAWVSLKVLQFQSYNRKGDALPLQGNGAAIIKNSALLMTSTELYLYGKANPSGRTGLPQLLQTHSTKQELLLQCDRQEGCK